ncbi:MAG: HEPN domain-containing protein [Cyanobacteria bacterium J06635_13]
MKVDQKILQRMNQLLEAGEKVLSTRKDPPRKVGNFVVVASASVNSQDAYQWFTSVQNLLARVFGIDSEHYKNFTDQKNQGGLGYYQVDCAQGVLKAAKDDYEHEQLFKLKKIIEAELFDDFLEQAIILLEAGFYQPSAIIAGSVLEDALRKLCLRNQIELPEKPKLNYMNAQLAKVGLYNKLTQKRITAIADIRNNAAHGKWDQFEKDDVEEAISWITRFMDHNYV